MMREAADIAGYRAFVGAASVPVRLARDLGIGSGHIGTEVLLVAMHAAAPFARAFSVPAARFVVARQNRVDIEAGTGIDSSALPPRMRRAPISLHTARIATLRSNIADADADAATRTHAEVDIGTDIGIDIDLRTDAESEPQTRARAP
ncbi:hypothetical protein J5226_11815 [Lysobacter sp. K5869]|uniref:hypothetical protein n=1 Tax=Lysobacter sp. K5869 TaxID=2820808 RepID=UPI001C063758|nr:hypothetical protein [Lysobacter sp. K5869]QWP79024.1 hypothetical protein J5226_11815 [Lysobacter sp. K5869]